MKHPLAEKRKALMDDFERNNNFPFKRKIIPF